MTDFCCSGPFKVVDLVGIVYDFAYWVSLVFKDVRQYDPWRSCLLSRRLLLFLVTLAFLFLAFWN
jgi:hypothetical protein